jgi:hypothetical protein
MCRGIDSLRGFRRCIAAVPCEAGWRHTRVVTSDVPLPDVVTTTIHNQGGIEMRTWTCLHEAGWAIAVAASLLAGCGSTKKADSDKPAAPAGTAATPAASGGPVPTLVKSRDGSFDGEVFGQPLPAGKFKKVQIGMEFSEVTQAIGAPQNMKSYETGKRWIPFYYGNDVRRTQTLYPAEGCLTFTDGNRFGGGGKELVAIHHDPSGNCFQ